MENRIILRTTANLSFAGEVHRNDLSRKEKSVLLKPSPKSEVKILFPIQEIKCIILPDGSIVEGEFERWI